ncbi:mucin-17 isoform X1 [Perca flavescens]|nr:mucin-17-like isoform X1 [Perca flavescens]XP_028452982.1 mucin-17-like isoform X1 [Perca flavescens]XP_028452991.1 mucin-17-like isoform X1 [Perca flavescens]XP_028453000.1 mucin-17-like isoform X1 [Perca flavescens]
MAFANLFTRLSAVEEGVKSPAGQPAFTLRNEETETGKRGNAKKRKAHDELTGSYKKKQSYQAHKARRYNAASFKDDDSKARHYHMHNTDNGHSSVGFIKEVMHNHGYNNMCHKGQNYKIKNIHNVNKQQQKKNPDGQKNLYQQKDRWRPANRDGNHQTRPAWRKHGGDSKNKNDKQEVQVKRPRFMTQEFRDQHAVLVDGRLVCRHFLYGRCIKADDCQLEHIQGYNDLIKEVCKFYIQGLCTKRESCPYMHQSFPCKFFHRNGKCSQGADCKFSHEPLNDVTNPLLNETLKRDNELYEQQKQQQQQQQLAQKAEQESSAQPDNTNESEIIEANGTPDTLLQPIRPNFYNSTNAEKETLFCQTEELADIMEEAVPPHPTDAAQPHDVPTSSNLSHEEPVCYSVAAVLGPQLSKPFPTFFTTRGCPESSSDCTSGSANQSDVPYSVDAVLRSCKSVGSSTFGHTPTTPTAQTVSYTPHTDFEESTVPLLSSETPNERGLYSLNTRNEVNKSQEKIFKSLSSHDVHTGLFSKTCPSPTLASRDYMKQGGNMPESLKLAQRAAHKVKSELPHSPVNVADKAASSEDKGDMKGSMHQPTDITSSLNCKSERVLPFGRTNCKRIFLSPPSQTSTSKHPTQLRPHLSVLTSDTEASKPFCPSSSFTEFKGGAAVPVEPVTCLTKTSDSANSASCYFAAKQPTEIHLHSKKTPSGLKPGTPRPSAEMTAERSSKMVHCGDLAVGCKKTLKRPFHSLFACPITDTLQPLDSSGTSFSCPQGLIQSSPPAPQSADCRGNCVESAVEPNKASAFRSLFTAPLPFIRPRPNYSKTSSCSQQPDQSVDNTSHSSNSKQRAANSEIPLPRQVRNDVKEIPHASRSPNFSTNPKIENEDSSTENLKLPTKQLVYTVCSLVSDSHSEMSTSPTPANSPSTTHTHQPLPDISSHKGSAVAATSNSVLKTLFLCLSPYQQDKR